MEEGKILQHLLQEVQGTSGFVEVDYQREISGNEQVNNMIENYRNHVKQQKKLSNGSGKNANCVKQNRTTQALNANRNNVQSNNVSLMSHSQPCLYSVGERRVENYTKNDLLHQFQSSDSRDESVLMKNSNVDENIQKAFFPSDRERMKNEIEVLKQQNSTLHQKTEKLKQLEAAYRRIEQEFEQIVTQREKHEQLEKAAMCKMDEQIQRLVQMNEFLQAENDRLNLRNLRKEQSASNAIGTENCRSDSGDNSIVNKLQNTTVAFVEDEQSQNQQQFFHMKMMINDLVPKNKELLAVEERQRAELDAQRTTLEEQRTHIDMLEKALTNAQERLAAKDRQAMDAVAVMDKCAHLQKLLQESLDDKQKRHEEHTKQKTQLEMELAQLRLQLSKDLSTFGPRKGAKSPENEEIVKLKKAIYGKDERITQLESSLLNIQKRYNEELQRNNAENVDTLRGKVHMLEEESLKKDCRIQDLIDEKQRIHNQWAEERRSLDHRVRLLEQDLRVLMMGSNGALSSNIFPSIPISSASVSGLNPACIRGTCLTNNTNVTGHAQPHQYSHQHHQPYSHNAFRPPLYGDDDSISGMNLSGMSAGSSSAFSRSNSGAGDGNITEAVELPTSTRTALIHDSTIARMEELRQKIADRRASVASSASSGSAGDGRQLKSHINREGERSSSYRSKNGSSISLIDNTSSKQNVGDDSQKIMSSSYYPSQHFQKLSSRASSRMSSHMPENITNYIESLPLPTRRRFVASEKVVLRNNPLSSANQSSANPHNDVSIISDKKLENNSSRINAKNADADLNSALFSRRQSGAAVISVGLMSSGHDINELSHHSGNDEALNRDHNVEYTGNTSKVDVNGAISIATNTSNIADSNHKSDRLVFVRKTP